MYSPLTEKILSECPCRSNVQFWMTFKVAPSSPPRSPCPRHWLRRSPWRRCWRGRWWRRRCAPPRRGPAAAVACRTLSRQESRPGSFSPPDDSLPRGTAAAAGDDIGRSWKYLADSEKYLKNAACWNLNFSIRNLYIYHMPNLANTMTNQNISIFCRYFAPVFFTDTKRARRQ